MEELLVAVDHNQLWTMASETVDPIDWSHPPPYKGQYPLSSTYCTVLCGLQITRLAALSMPRTCDLRNARPTHCLCGHSGLGAVLSFRRLGLFGHVVRIDDAEIERFGLLRCRDVGHREDQGRLEGNICRRNLQEEQALNRDQWRTDINRLTS